MTVSISRPSPASPRTSSTRSSALTTLDSVNNKLCIVLRRRHEFMSESPLNICPVAGLSSPTGVHTTPRQGPTQAYNEHGGTPNSIFDVYVISIHGASTKRAASESATAYHIYRRDPSKDGGDQGHASNGSARRDRPGELRVSGADVGLPTEPEGCSSVRKLGHARVREHFGLPSQPSQDDQELLRHVSRRDDRAIVCVTCCRDRDHQHVLCCATQQRELIFEYFCFFFKTRQVKLRRSPNVLVNHAHTRRNEAGRTRHLLRLYSNHTLC